MVRKRKTDEKDLKTDVNNRHIVFYGKVLDSLEFLLEKFSKGLEDADFDFVELPKNCISTFDFLISSLVKIQKGQRLALGLDDEKLENYEPEINIVEGLSEGKI